MLLLNCFLFSVQVLLHLQVFPVSFLFFLCISLYFLLFFLSPVSLYFLMSYFSGHKSVLLFCISAALLCSSFHLLYFPHLKNWMDIYIISNSVLKLLMILLWSHYSQLLEDCCLLIPISELLVALFLLFMLFIAFIFT